jgi:F0F1-type ATP synthase membrane subunit c/vacuolar-type H+-ATPase subunit K
MNKKTLIVLSLFFVLLFISYSTTFAQVASSGIAISIPVSDPEAQDGDIICTYPEGNVRCSQEYDPSVYGVISDDPALSIEDFDLISSKLIVTSGIATVRVTSVNGNITEGDLITTSLKPGLGQKASRNGYVLGTAVENYESDNPDTVGRVQVALNIHPASGLSGTRGNLIQFIRQGLAVPVFEPVESLRYILAALMVIISFTLGMIYFGRASRTGIEAVGRNPLAKRVIQLTIFMNIALTIVIVIVGLAIAYLILVF